MDGWQSVKGTHYTWRLHVPGGWIYRYRTLHDGCSCMTFVPDYRMAPTMPSNYHDSGVPGDGI